MIGILYNSTGKIFPNAHKPYLQNPERQNNVVCTENMQCFKSTNEALFKIHLNLKHDFTNNTENIFIYSRQNTTLFNSTSS